MYNKYILLIMKKRLNFITALIGVALGFMLANSEMLSSFTEGFAEGYKEGYDAVKNMDESAQKEKNDVFFLELRPVNGITARPSALLNQKSGEWMPASLSSVKVSIPSAAKSGWMKFWKVAGVLLFMAGFIMCGFNFLKVIFAVNKSVIFEWINVKRLRRTGLGFIVLFLSGIMLELPNHLLATTAIELADYSIKRSIIEGNTLLLGMITLLVAEVFAVGLRMREEQELTI